ncbi:MAG: RagB/SusD family nutrient uptake outer membrane protein [Chitinophagaceae bacterium]|nr:RagB/SusD family nutrient uptake outer membrane protein [Chitinophagaceae bacterium]
MKNYNAIAILISFAFAVLSCARLEEKPASFISETQFYKTEADAKQAVTAAYYMLNAGDASTPGGLTVQTPYNVLFSTGMEMMTDDINPGPGATNADVRSQSVLQHNSAGLRVLQIWQQHYAAVRAANIAIQKIPGITFSASTLTTQKRYIAECKFLRALYYFNLVRLYGDVPLILEDQNVFDNDAIQVPRNPAADVYTQIIADLNAAAVDLPATYAAADAGRATKGAAIALLSKVYLTQKNWAAAATAAETVIGSGTYGLFSNYSQVFLPANKNGIEHVFSAQYKANSQGQGNGNAPRGMRSAVPGYTASYADQLVYYIKGADHYFSIYKLYQPNDQRKKYSFITKILGSDNTYYSTLNAPGDTVPFLHKYFDPGVGAQLSESAANVPIIRYSEVLLIAAEAENEANAGPTGLAYTYVNQVRARAGIPDLTTGLDVNQFRDSVYLERRLELVWEWQRWFDLIRELPNPTISTGAGSSDGQGRLVNSLKEVGKNSATTKHYLYPIPLQEIQLNPKLTQNPGW